MSRYPDMNLMKAHEDDLGISASFLKQELLGKEVIQPQVPLRLPCYDFTPVTSHTIGGSVPLRG